MAEQHEPEQQATSNRSCGFNLGLMDALSACGSAGSAPEDSAAAGPSGADIDGGTATGSGPDATAGTMAGLSLDSSTAAAAATDNGAAADSGKKKNDAEGVLVAAEPPIAQQQRQRQQTAAASNHRGQDRIDFARRCTLRQYDDEDTIIVAEEANKATPDTDTDTDTPEKTQTEKTPTKPAPTSRKNTKVKRKSSTLGALSSPFSSSLRSSSSRTSSMKSPLQKELPNQPVPPNTWSSISASKFSVRTGPNYAGTGRKLPSLESLYDVAAVRMYTSSRGTTGASEVLPLPPGVDSERKGTASLPVEIPAVLVVHVQMPHDAPSMFQPSADGPGTECVVYLRPSRRLLAETSGAAPMAPATNLFLKWCQTAATDGTMRGRFKCMALVRSLEAHNLGWVAPYNGKPVLITESGTCRVGALPADGGGNTSRSAAKNSSTDRTIRYLEMTANVHRWGYLAKKGFVSLLPKFRELRLDIGFAIEGRADDELPECILGCFAANFCDEGSLERMPDELLK